MKEYRPILLGFHYDLCQSNCHNVSALFQTCQSEMDVDRAVLNRQDMAFDISLLYILMRNICQKSMYSKKMFKSSETTKKMPLPYKQVGCTSSVPDCDTEFCNHVDCCSTLSEISDPCNSATEESTEIIRSRIYAMKHGILLVDCGRLLFYLNCSGKNLTVDEQLLVFNRNMTKELLEFQQCDTEILGLSLMDVFDSQIHDIVLESIICHDNFEDFLCVNKDVLKHMNCCKGKYQTINCQNQANARALHACISITDPGQHLTDADNFRSERNIMFLPLNFNMLCQGEITRSQQQCSMGKNIKSDKSNLTNCPAKESLKLDLIQGETSKSDINRTENNDYGRSGTWKSFHQKIYFIRHFMLQVLIMVKSVLHPWMNLEMMGIPSDIKYTCQKTVSLWQLGYLCFMIQLAPAFASEKNVCTREEEDLGSNFLGRTGQMKQCNLLINQFYKSSSGKLKYSELFRTLQAADVGEECGYELQKDYNSTLGKPLVTEVKKRIQRCVLSSSTQWREEIAGKEYLLQRKKILCVCVLATMIMMILIITLWRGTSPYWIVGKKEIKEYSFKEKHIEDICTTSYSKEELKLTYDTIQRKNEENKKTLNDDDELSVVFPDFLRLDDDEDDLEEILENADTEAVFNLPIRVEQADCRCETVFTGSSALRSTLLDTLIEIEVEDEDEEKNLTEKNEFMFMEVPSDSLHCSERKHDSTNAGEGEISMSHWYEMAEITELAKGLPENSKVFCQADFENGEYYEHDDNNLIQEKKDMVFSDPSVEAEDSSFISKSVVIVEDSGNDLSIGLVNPLLDSVWSSFPAEEAGKTPTIEKRKDGKVHFNEIKSAEFPHDMETSSVATIFASILIILQCFVVQTEFESMVRKEICKAASHFKRVEIKNKRLPQRQLREVINWYISLQRNTSPDLQLTTSTPLRYHKVNPSTEHGPTAIQRVLNGERPAMESINERNDHGNYANNPQNVGFVGSNGQQHPGVVAPEFRSNVEIGSARINNEAQPWRSMPESLLPRGSHEENHTGEQEMSLQRPSNDSREIPPTRQHRNSLSQSSLFSNSSVISRDGDFSSDSDGSSGSHPFIQSSETSSTSQSTNFDSLSTFFSSFSAASSPPEHEGLHYEWIRLKTFGTFPIYSHYSTVLAKSGWYHLGESDKTCCFSCSIVHEGWNRTDDPNNFHSPDCRFLNGSSGNVPIVRDLPAVMPPERQPQPPPLQREREAVATLLGAQNSSVNNEPMVAQTSSSSENILPANPQESVNSGDVPTPTLSVLPQLTGVQNHSSRRETSQPSASDIAQRIQQIQLQNQTAADHIQSHATAVGNFSSSQQSAASNIPQRHAYAASHQTNDLENSESGSDATSREAQMEALRRDPMGINFDRPKYPSYAILVKRVSSYTNWPSSLTQTPRDMALAGFFYAGYGDYCRCFFCGGGLRNWEPGDDPWVEHARWFSKCAFVRQNRGQSFIDLVLRRAAEVEEERRQNGNTTTSATNSNTNDGAKSQAESKEEKLMKSAAVQSIKEMGYTEAQIKAAIAAIKRRLPTGKHKVSAQEILEVIFELIDAGELQSASDENTANQDHTQGQNETMNQPTANSNSVSYQSTERVQENQQTSEVQRQETPSSEVRNHSEISDSMPSFTLDELTSLRQENTSLREQIVCKICMDKNVSIAFLPCGHLACCEDCAPAMRKCPICRQFVKGTVKTYLV